MSKACTADEESVKNINAAIKTVPGSRICRFVTIIVMVLACIGLIIFLAVMAQINAKATQEKCRTARKTDSEAEYQKCCDTVLW